MIVYFVFRQLDIGLEKFETGELFVRLLTPTFFVIITVVQLYYFHNDFLAISDIKSRLDYFEPITMFNIRILILFTI